MILKATKTYINEIPVINFEIKIISNNNDMIVK
jgi:hypothetical protein